MKRGIIYLVILALLIPIAVADVVPVSFSVEVEPVDDRITNQEPAEFNIIVENNLAESDVIKLEPLEDLKWSMQAKDVLDYQTGREVGPYERVVIPVWFKQTELPDGDHRFKLTLVSKLTGYEGSTVIKIHKGAEPIDYNPDFSVSLEIPAQMDPRTKHIIRVILLNNNPLDLSNIEVALESELINERTTTSLGGDEDKSVSFTVNLPEDLEPTSDVLKVAVTHKGKTFFAKSVPYATVEYVPPFAKEVREKGGTVKRTKIITITNEANIPKNGTVRVETTKFRKMFTKTDPEVSAEKAGGRYFYNWDLTLEPGDTLEIRITTSFWSLVILAIILISGLVAYQLLKNPVLVRKEVKNVEFEHEAISEVKVLIHLKNRTGQTLKDVKILERIPNMAGVKKGSFDNTLHPTKAYKHGAGTVLEYHLAELEPYEERMISYELKARLHLLGDIHLKPTIVRFTGKQKMKSSSNKVTVQGLKPVAEEY